MFKIKNLFLLLISLSTASTNLTAQSNSELLKEIDLLNSRIKNMSYSFDQLNKKIEDVSWYNLLGDIAYVDKVRLTGPPAKIKSKTAKGAGNPLMFWTYVFIPKEIDQTKKYPLIVLVHGGVHGNFGISNNHILTYSPD